MECITTSLMNKVPERSKIEKQMSEMIIPGTNTPTTEENKYNFMTIDISARDKVYGYAGLYRVLPFHEDEKAIFSRFCSNIAMTLEKISLSTRLNRSPSMMDLPEFTTMRLL
jgi:hypothetical protein